MISVVFLASIFLEDLGSLYKNNESKNTEKISKNVFDPFLGTTTKIFIKKNKNRQTINEIEKKKSLYLLNKSLSLSVCVFCPLIGAKTDGPTEKRVVLLDAKSRDGKKRQKMAKN